MRDRASPVSRAIALGLREGEFPMDWRDMGFHVFTAGYVQTNAYLLTAPDRAEAVLIDAPEGIWSLIAPVLKRENCRLVALWFTHGHWDHMQGGAEVVKHTLARTAAHLDDRGMLETPSAMGFVMNLKLEAVKIDRWVGQGDSLEALGQRFEVRHVPGHCPGSILFYNPGTQEAFVGDALFKGSIGRTDLPGGSFPVLDNSIRTQIYTLPNLTKLYPGHGPETTVAQEKAENPFVNE